MIQRKALDLCREIIWKQVTKTQLKSILMEIGKAKNLKLRDENIQSGSPGF